MDPLHTIADVVQCIEENNANNHAFNYLENGKWRHISTEQFLFDLKRLTYGLISLGLRRGDAVGILADCSPFWNMADFAIIMAGGITVPLFVRISHENFIYECAQSNIRFLFVQGKSQWQLYEDHRNLFEQVIAIDDPENVTGALNWHDVLKKGELLWGEKPGLWDELSSQLKADDICTIIYTAGATGMPKGVLLSNQNLCHLISFPVFGWDKYEDTYLSILPLAHVFARQINIILIAWGVSVYYLNDLSRLMEVSRDIKPSLTIVVPRVLEKMFSAMEAKIKAMQQGVAGRLVAWAFRLACSPKNSFIKKYLLFPIADYFVYSRFRQSLGGNWRVILCGGAALNPTLNEFYLNIGMPVYEGWGLTEASTTACNLPGMQKVGTVGKTLPGVKVKLGDNDELLLGGPTIMQGYYRNPQATEEVIDSDGWLHTGDKGKIDDEGFIKITGRVKEQFKLSSGEYLSPSGIEHMLAQHPLVDIAMVVGEKRKYASCLLFLDKQAVERAKQEQGFKEKSDEEFFASRYFQGEIEKLLDHVNRKINTWERVVKYRIIPDIPSIEGGELTPTLKFKRDVILQKYQAIIDSIYSEEKT